MKPAGAADILIKEEAETDPRYGCPPEKRDIKTYLNNGIVNIDKPAGPNSHQVTAWVKQILGVEKAGHSGTLDPKVTGVLPIALGNATKIIKALLLSDKEYICLMSLHDAASKDCIEQVFRELQGPIFQTPPVMSAVKRELTHTKHLRNKTLGTRPKRDTLQGQMRGGDIHKKTLPRHRTHPRHRRPHA